MCALKVSLFASTNPPAATPLPLRTLLNPLTLEDPRTLHDRDERKEIKERRKVEDIMIMPPCITRKDGSLKKGGRESPLQPTSIFPSFPWPPRTRFKKEKKNKAKRKMKRLPNTVQIPNTENDSAKPAQTPPIHACVPPYSRFPSFSPPDSLDISYPYSYPSFLLPLLFAPHPSSGVHSSGWKCGLL